jgi:hypothetical protein
MEQENVSNLEYQGEGNLERNAKITKIKEVLYRFFYNIWPSVNRVLSFFFYHIIRIIKGSVKIAMEQFRHGG